MQDALEDLARQHGVDTAAVPAALRSEIVRRMSADALVRRYMQATRNTPARITEPWMALAEQRMMALLLASDKDPVAVVHGAQESQELSRSQVAAALVIAQTYLWSNDVFAAVRACPLPAHVISDNVLPFPASYHSFEVAHKVTFCDGSMEDMVDPITDWLLLVASPEGSGAHIFQHIVGADSTQIGVMAHGMRYGRKFPDDFPPTSHEPMRVLLSMLAFLNSPYSAVEQRRLPRQMRRHESALSTKDAEKVVSVVTLRAAAREAINAYEAESKAFRHRWWVSGHIRKQWIPSTQSHELRWIAPYIKGPDGAPMLDRVYAVTR